MSCAASKVLSKLNPELAPSEVYASLISLRTKHLKSASTSADLVKKGLVRRLLTLLQRPNTKIVDVTLSILGNLMLESVPRKQIRDRELRGIPILVGVLSTLSEESILGRAARTVANVSLDPKNAGLLHKQEIVPILVKVLSEAKSDKTKQIVVRAIRILGTTDSHKRRTVDAQAISAVSTHLYSEDVELVKAVVKCLAHFTHGCLPELAWQVGGDDSKGFKRLVELMAHEHRSIWEAAMACLVNLSKLDDLRPSLGNAGTVTALVEKMNSCHDLSPKEVAHCVTALCLYCREAVNRMKLRESGGLKLFVSILGSTDRSSLHPRIVNSLLQYGYDESSLRVLQQEGLIPRLVSFIVDYTAENGVKHSCAEEICPCDDKEQDAAGSRCMSPVEEERGERGSDDTAAVMETEESKAGQDELDVEEKRDNKEVRTEFTADASATSKEARFRVNSPSYQAVQHEFEEYLRLQNEWNQQLQQPRLYESPNNSMSLSPDRSPYAWSSPGYSPIYSAASSPFSSGSCFTSPSSSPSHSLSPSPRPLDSGGNAAATEESYSSPSSESSHDADKDCDNSEEGQLAYSPVERFSDDEAEDEPKPSTSSGMGHTTSCSPPKKKSRLCDAPPAKLVLSSAASGLDSHLSPSYVSSFNQFSPFPSPSPDHLSAFNPIATLRYKSNADTSSIRDGKEKENSFIGWVLQVLSRLSHAERPHEDMMNLETTKALINYLVYVKDPLSRAGRVLVRLSRNLYCVMSIVTQRHMSWMKLALDSRPSLADECMCAGCKELFLLRSHLNQNVSVLAESGYAEGQMCHLLMRGSSTDKHCVAISAPMVVRSRKLLRNILLVHEGLDNLLEVLESISAEDAPDQEPSEDFVYAVLSANTLAAHLGVIAPNLTLPERSAQSECLYDASNLSTSDTVTFVLDSGEEVAGDRAQLTSDGGVFEAMLSGGFAESSQQRVLLPETSRAALLPLLHHLHGCRGWCSQASAENGVGLSLETLFELVSLADRYLLPELVRYASIEIVRRCFCADQVVNVYEKSLQHGGDYSCLVGDDASETLAASAVNFLLVGTMSNTRRVQIFAELVRSRMCADFVDDVGKVIRSRLLEAR